MRYCACTLKDCRKALMKHLWLVFSTRFLLTDADIFMVRHCLNGNDDAKRVALLEVHSRRVPVGCFCKGVIVERDFTSSGGYGRKAE